MALGAAECDSARSPLLQPVGISSPVGMRDAHPAGACAALPGVNSRSAAAGEGAAGPAGQSPPLVPGFLLECEGSIRIYPVREPVRRVYLGSKRQLSQAGKLSS